MTTIINTKLGEKGNAKRIWLEGTKLAREGYQPGQKYDLELKDSEVVIRVNESGKYIVSKRTRNGVTKPIIDITSQQLAELFQGVETVRVLIRKETIVISAHHQHAQVKERLERFINKIETGQPLTVCSLFHGGGVLDKAIHSGLKRAGIPSTISVAVEMEPKYLDASLRNNRELWNDRSIVIESEIQAIDLKRNPPLVEICVAGIPCEGASPAGRSRNKTWGDSTGGYAESHASSGALFFNFLQFIDAVQPMVIVLENVGQYSSSASMEVIRSVLASWGYNVQETILDGNAFGVLERRKRLCVVATTVGFDMFDINNVIPLRKKEQTISEILEPIPLDSPIWREFTYLKDKMIADMAKGNGFKRQLLTGDAEYLGTIGKSYQKARSTEPFILHPENPELSRLLTPLEHCRVKGVPPSIIDNESDTVAHEILGQGIVFPAFEAVAYALGKSCWESVNKKLVQIEVVDIDQCIIGGSNFHWVPAIIEPTGILKLAPTAESWGMPIHVDDGVVRIASTSGTDISCSHEPCETLPVTTVGNQLRLLAA